MIAVCQFSPRVVSALVVNTELVSVACQMVEPHQTNPIWRDFYFQQTSSRVSHLCAVFHATFVTVALIKFKHDFVLTTVGNELFEQIAALIAEVTAHDHRRDVVNVRYRFVRANGAPLSVFADLYSSFNELFSEGLHFFSPMCNYSYALLSISE